MPSPFWLQSPYAGHIDIRHDSSLRMSICFHAARRWRDSNPRGGYTPPNPLAGGPIRPLWHISKGVVLHGWEDSNLHRAVLETAVLPIKLHPYGGVTGGERRCLPVTLCNFHFPGFFNRMETSITYFSDLRKRPVYIAFSTYFGAKIGAVFGAGATLYSL